MDKHKRLINLVYSNSKYMGKHIVIIGGKIYSAENGKLASKLLDKLILQHPNETPTITYIPKADALILLIPFDEN
ncbi:MAG: hypothetical protein QME05_00405 [Candidatus Margulisbacteria bacterium]|nr:hypothetical protein [Candidatus Margulisiibacteriota bacterium]